MFLESFVFAISVLLHRTNREGSILYPHILECSNEHVNAAIYLHISEEYHFFLPINLLLAIRNIVYSHSIIR